MQVRFGRRHGWRAVVVLLIFAFGSQPLIGTAGSVAAVSATAAAPQPVAPAVATATNPEPPLAGLAQPFDAPAGARTSDQTNDPRIERGNVRPPRPEPAGTIVDAETTRHTRTISKGDGTYTQTTSEEAINYLDDRGHWQPIDLGLVPEASGSGFAKRTKANDRVVELSDHTGSDLARLSGGKLSFSVKVFKNASRSLQ